MIAAVAIAVAAAAAVASAAASDGDAAAALLLLCCSFDRDCVASAQGTPELPAAAGDVAAAAAGAARAAAVTLVRVESGLGGVRTRGGTSPPGVATLLVRFVRHIDLTALVAVLTRQNLQG